MPTLTEITDPKYTYCNKFDVHCPCVKCRASGDDEEWLECGDTDCNECGGWQGEVIKNDKAIPSCPRFEDHED